MHMHKASYRSEELKHMQESIILLHGVFEESFFDILQAKQYQDIFIMEGRPNLDAGRIACRQLLKRNITPTLIADNMAGFLFFNNLVKEAWLAYGAIEEKGVMCHIGASIVSLLAKKHNVPLFCYPSQGDTAALGEGKDMVTFKEFPVAPKQIETYVPLMEWVEGKCFDVSENEDGKKFKDKK